MSNNLTKEQLMEHDAFKNAMSISHTLSTDEITLRLEEVDYPSFGYKCVLIYRMLDETGAIWKAGLRNHMNWKEPVLECKSKKLKEALNLLFAWCIYKKYLTL